MLIGFLPFEYEQSRQRVRCYIEFTRFMMYCEIARLESLMLRGSLNKLTCLPQIRASMINDLYNLSILYEWPSSGLDFSKTAR